MAKRNKVKVLTPARVYSENEAAREKEERMSKKDGGTHPVKRISVKMADVDIKVIPVVNWLNAFDNVITLYSCQGEPERDDPKKGFIRGEQPYVMFLCMDPLILIRIISEVQSYAESVEVNWFEGCLRYCIRFWTDESLKMFIERIEK